MSANTASHKKLLLALPACTAILLGSLLTTSVVSADDDDVGEFTVSLEQATAIALEQVPGTILGAEVETEDGLTVWEIDVRDAEGVIYEVELNANTGEVMEVEKDD